MTRLDLDRLTVRLGDREVVRNATFAISEGQFVGLIGPNGAGKTTLLRAALGLLASTGASSLAELAPTARARAAAFLPQSREIAWPMTVERVVSLGRLPHLAAGHRPEGADAAAIDAALDAMDLGALRERIATRLSGGEQARVLLARVLAQEAPLVLADEPVAGLDPAHQIATMETFGRLARSGASVLASLHDLALAHRWCDRILLMAGGVIVADGPPREVLTTDALRHAFGVEARVMATPDGDALQILGRAS